MEKLLNMLRYNQSKRNHNKKEPGRDFRRQIVPLKDKDGHFLMHHDGRTVRTRVILHPVNRLQG